ncbi:MAG: alpha/beta fold hydrolase [Gemmatimonadota bacterium]
MTSGTAAALTALVLVAGCRQTKADQAKQPGSPADVPCVPELPGAEYHCGELVVPESRDSLGGRSGPRSITLPFVVLPATRMPRQPDPIIYLTGGPGTSAFAGLLQVAAYQQAGSDRDFIVMEERGNGYSTPALTCDNLGLPRADTIAAKLVACRDSLTRSGIDLGKYGVLQAAADYLDLARAVGAERINLYALSSGARSALELMRTNPGKVRAVVLDSPDPGTAESRIAHAGGALDALSRLLAACRADPACRRAYPDAREQFVQVVSALERRPASFANETITSDRFFEMVAGALSDQAKLGGIPGGLAAASRGDWATASRLLQRGADVPEGLDMSRLHAAGRALVLECGDDSAPISAFETEEQWPASVAGLALGLVRADASRCSAWAGPAAAAPRNREVVTRVPTLVMAGANDPTTPPSLANVVATSLPRATLIVPPATALEALRQSCPRAVMRAFLANPAAPPDRACIDSMLPIEFEVP